MRQLLPEVARTTVDEQIASLDLAGAAHPERPYVVSNFALTLDGHAGYLGRPYRAALQRGRFGSVPSGCRSPYSDRRLPVS